MFDNTFQSLQNIYLTSKYTFNIYTYLNNMYIFCISDRELNDCYVVGENNEVSLTFLRPSKVNLIETWSLDRSIEISEAKNTPPIVNRQMTY